MSDLLLDRQLGARELTDRSSSNFAMSFYLLPKEKRDAMYAVYAFCRHSDDIVDQLASEEIRREQLNSWRVELDACFDGRANCRLMQDLDNCLKRYRIPKDYFLELLNGVEMDLDNVEYHTFEDLYKYCYRVASIVGLMCIEIFGYRNQSAKAYAEYLGIALQLTNILRDVGDDARSGRVYLPLTELERFGVSLADVREGVNYDNFCKYASFHAGLAQEYFDKAAAALALEDKRSMLAAEVMGKIYHQLLLDIEAGGFRAFERRVSVSTTSKFFIAAQVWWGGR